MFDFSTRPWARLGSEIENLHNEWRSTAPDSLGGFFVLEIWRGMLSAFTSVTRLRGQLVCPGREPKASWPNHSWGSQPPESERLRTVLAPAMSIATNGAERMNATNPQVTTSSIVSILNGVPTATSITIAEGTRVQHKNVMELVRTYQADLEEFGSLAFETRVTRQDGRGGEQAEIALLNERQATMIMTYMRNTAVVREFKKRLVKAFYELAEVARLAPPTPPNPIQGKASRAVLADQAIQLAKLTAVIEAMTTPKIIKIPTLHDNQSFHEGQAIVQALRDQCPEHLHPLINSVEAVLVRGYTEMEQSLFQINIAKGYMHRWMSGGSQKPATKTNKE